MAIGRWDRDPVNRRLRVISICAFLTLIVLIVQDPSRDDLPLTALLVGAILLQLGYEVIVPGLSRRPPRDKDRTDD